MSAGPRWGGRLGVAGIAATALVITLTDVSYAYYTSHGSGAGTATTGTVTITLPTPAPTLSGLYPGITDVPVQVAVTNPNASAAVVLKSVTSDTITVDHSGCSASAITFTPAASLNTPIPANTTSSPVTIGSVKMSTAAEDACQGATFMIPITVTGQVG